jgi:hypothetical protein
MVSKPIPARIRERKACDAVARCLEALSQELRSDAYFPEDAAKGQSQIDYAFQLGNTKYAFEHTVVEAFPGQLEADAHFEKFIEPIEGALDYQMPSTGYFVLQFPINPTAGMRPSEINSEQKKVIAWANAAGRELSEEVEASGLHLSRRWQSRPPTKIMPGSDVTLSFQPDSFGVMGSRIMAVRKAPPHYDKLRVDRIRKSLNTKLPKLALWKKERARTVLVLENRDMALTNHWEVSDCLELALQGRCDAPDAVWFVDGIHPTQWVTVCIREGSVIFPHEDSQVRFREFNESELNALPL